jgi:hypothetical protein
MTRRIAALAALAVLAVLGLLLAGEGVRSAPSPDGPAPLGKGWGRLLASGIIAAVDRSAGTVTLAITGSGRLRVFEGGAAWQEKTATGTQRLHLLPATLVVDAHGQPIPATAVRARDSAIAWGVVRPDGAILAVTLAVAAARASAAAGAPSGAARAAPEGVVLRRSESMMQILTSQGIPRSVVVTPATVVSSAGAAIPITGLSPYDVVEVDGPLNSDGSLAATRIDVAFNAASAAQVAGPVEQSIGDLHGFVVAGTMIATSADTYVIQKAARVVFASVRPGRPVAVYGSAIVAGTVPVGLRARIVVVR